MRDEVHGSLAVPGHEYPQVGMETIADPGHLRDGILACFDEEGDLEVRISQVNGHPVSRELATLFHANWPPPSENAPATSV